MGDGREYEVGWVRLDVGGGGLMSLTIDTHTHRSLDAFVVVCLFLFSDGGFYVV